MRDLFTRMFEEGTRQYPKIAVHTLPSFLADYALGGRSRSDVTNHFNMIDRDRLDTNRLMDQIDTRPNEESKIALVTFYEFVMRIEEADLQPIRSRFYSRLGI